MQIQEIAFFWATKVVAVTTMHCVRGTKDCLSNNKSDCRKLDVVFKKREMFLLYQEFKFQCLRN